MTTKIQYQRNKELETVCWNLSKKTVQEHRNHPSCGTWRNKESPFCPSLNQLCLTTTIFNLVKAVHNEPIDGFDGTSLCLQEVLQSLTACSDKPRNWTNTNQDSQKDMTSSQQAGYLNCWPEPRSTGCSIPKCNPTGNPTRTPFGGGDPTEKRTVPESQPTYPKVLEKSLNWKKANSRITQAAGGMNIKWDHSQKLAGRSGWWGWWGYVRIVDIVRMVRMVRMFSKSSESGGSKS